MPETWYRRTSNDSKKGTRDRDELILGAWHFRAKHLFKYSMQRVRFAQW